MKAHLLLFVCLLSSLSCTTRVGPRIGTPVQPVRVAGFTLREDVIYTPPGWPQALPADVYVPDGPGPWPGILLIHGGSWANKDRRSDMDGIAGHLARRGYVVMNATYRLAPQHIHPAQIHDLQQATRWLRTHADQLHLQPDHLGVFGYSAGGHLAALLAALDAPADLRFQAVVAGGAPSDLRKFDRSPIVTTYLGGSLQEKSALYAAASPVTHLTSDDPPVFIYHGTRDTLVPPDHASDYAAALKKVGIPHELVWQNGRGHIAAFLSYGDILTPALSFLDRHLRQPK
ncbi:acetyl esterase/lipase [Prosthecobacter fusiformis]|uniref:Acetyl esterase/lipase n=1 Tax=Prosthecobacter fusiformis TaxID=48464 RepID=A0A4R7RL78_9BACT|nr:alpha/beta hydrolase [Prosthecobacter fusiformis]TDU66022.1 acetyl esterase/lipase [Prosthecobacter fusiformis]